MFNKITIIFNLKHVNKITYIINMIGFNLINFIYFEINLIQNI